MFSAFEGVSASWERRNNVAELSWPKSNGTITMRLIEDSRSQQMIAQTLRKMPIHDGNHVGKYHYSHVPAFVRRPRLSSASIRPTCMPAAALRLHEAPLMHTCQTFQAGSDRNEGSTVR